MIGSIIQSMPGTLRAGSTGTIVKTLQCVLKTSGVSPSLVVDGIFGPKTEAAVESYQKSHGLVQDGIVGPKTWKVLLNIEVLGLNSKGPSVKILQCSLNSAGSSPALVVDGIFGPKTDAAFNAFQKSHALEQGGKVGWKTWKALLNIQESVAAIIYHKDWTEAVQNTENILKSRGYAVSLTDDGGKGLTMLKDCSKNLWSGDRMLVYLAGHGSNPRGYGDTTKSVALQHFVQFNSGNLFVSQVAPIFETLAKGGVHLTVIDGSCNGGETVYNAIGQDYCAVATTGVYMPSLTNFPDPSNAIQKEGKPSTFGLWWDDPHLAAGWMNGAIISGVPERIHQRLFRNDRGEFSGLSLFIRAAVGVLNCWDLGGWNLHYSYCYLYRYIYPDQYDALTQEEKNKFTNDAQSFIAIIRAIVDPQSTFISSLQSNLDNEELMAGAAKAYASGYSRAWQTLANDPEWNPSADPHKYVDKMYGLSPKDYLGEAGFSSLAQELKNLVVLLQIGFAQQEELLRKIDAKIQDINKLSSIVLNLPKLQKTTYIPQPGDFRMHYNEFERKALNDYKAMDRQVKMDLSNVMQPMQPMKIRAVPTMDIKAISVKDKEVMAKYIMKDAAQYKNYSKTEGLEDRVVISQSNINKKILLSMRTKLVDLIKDFKSISPTLSQKDGRASFVMALIEDAVAKVQGGGNNPGDVTFY